MQFLYFLEGLRSPALDAVFRVITELGGETVYMALAIAVYWCVSKGLGCYILTTGFVGTIANQFLKLCFRIPRPWVLDPDFTIVESARRRSAGAKIAAVCEHDGKAQHGNHQHRRLQERHGPQDQRQVLHDR